ELALVRFRFDQTLVADAQRDEEARALGHGERRVHDHAEQTELRREELARAAPATLEEELDREPVADQSAHVGVDHGGVEAIAAERPTNEETAAPSQDRPHGEEIEVVAGRGERERKV